MSSAPKAKSPPRCFVISPIGDPGQPARKHADMVLHSIIKPALTDMEVKRADELGVINAIMTYEIAIADLSTLNANVFYELGLRHMANKPVIHIAAEGTKLPFDNAGVKTIWFAADDWHSHVSARTQIKDAVAERLRPDYKLSNPVTQAMGKVHLSLSADTNEQMLASAMSRIDSVETGLQNIQRLLSTIYKALNPPSFASVLQGDTGLSVQPNRMWVAGGPQLTVSNSPDPVTIRGVADPLAIRGVADPLTIRGVTDPLTIRGATSDDPTQPKKS